nr:MAG: putative RNA-dependent RNA polymerase [Mitoviridae sp.]
MKTNNLFLNTSIKSLKLNQHIIKYTINILIRNITNTQKDGSITIHDRNIPRLNIKRNQKRLDNVMKGILAYINLLSNVNDNIKLEYASLIHKFEMLYMRNPMEFVNLQKLLSNWLVVNVGRDLRLQDNIPDIDWSVRERSPMILSNIMRFIDQQKSVELRNELIRLTLSVMDAYNATLVPGLPQTLTITKQSTVDEVDIKSINICRALDSLGVDIEQFRNDFENENRAERFHSSSSAGPNGQAMWMAHIDARAIIADNKLLSNLTDFSIAVNRSSLIEKLRSCFTLPDFYKITREIARHSKLHFIFEKGNKVRTIAIVDWWTQELLTPLHHSIANILKTFENDGTFSQDKVSERVKNWTSFSNLDLYSLDLTAATDRLPIKLQERILSVLVGNDKFGELWSKLLVDRDYVLPGGGSVRYAVGQPMGAKSSFPMLGLTHHIIVQEAAARMGILSFKDYVILGDDIVIANRLVASEYVNIMNRLGLEVSPYKSISSEVEGRIHNVANICRRTFIDGLEVSPIPTKLLANVAESGHMFYQLQEEMFKRDQLNNVTNYPLFVSAIISNVTDFQRIALLNGLPSYLTGMKSRITVDESPKYNYLNWDKLYGISEKTLHEFFVFSVCSEQMKKLSMMAQTTMNTFSIISNAAKAYKAEAIGFESGMHVAMNEFEEDNITDWELEESYHPMSNIVNNELERISHIFMQLSVAKGDHLVNTLLSKVIETLKISSADMMSDQRFVDSMVTRRIIDNTISNIGKANLNDMKMLSYSVKLNPLNVIWSLKVKIDGDCSLSRTASKISTTMKDAQDRLSMMKSSDSVLNIFDSSKSK